MLDKLIAKKIREKMIDNHITYAMLGRQFNVSRQAIYQIINTKCSSNNLETKLIEWYNSGEFKINLL